MNHFSTVEVVGKALEREFLEMPCLIYANDPTWIRPLDNDIEEVFDPKRNKRFRKGECIRWLLRDSSGTNVGRIAAFVDPVTFKAGEPQVGGVGFFECIRDQQAANLLLDTAKAWLQSRGMEGMDGPINFGDRDRWWGCLKEGFLPTTYCISYNPSYYNELLESYGFQNYFDQLTYTRPISIDGMVESLVERGNRLLDNPAYTFKHAIKGEYDKLASDFNIVYNGAWSKYVGAGDMTLANTKLLIKTLKPIIDVRLLNFAYHDGEPVGFFIMIPDLNQAIKHLNGQFNLWAKLKLMYHLKIRKSTTRAVGIIFGVIPEFQGRGVEAGMICHFAKVATHSGFQYNDLEFNWIGDFNPVMMRLMSQIGSTVRKRHVTYRLWFDGRPFERCPKFGKAKKNVDKASDIVS